MGLGSGPEQAGNQDLNQEIGPLVQLLVYCGFGKLTQLVSGALELTQPCFKLEPRPEQRCLPRACFGNTTYRRYS